MKKVCILTGGTSGIGRETALALLNKGYTVYELSRRADGLAGTEHIVTDVTDEAQVNRAVAEVLKKEDHIDAVVNNAGFGISGAIEFTDTAAAKKQFDVNFFGMVNVNHAVLPVLRKQGYGRIVNLSSVAAPIAIPFQAYYSASKAAINAYTLALANEIRPYGVTVCCVQPGDIKTGFTAAREKTAVGDEEYNGRISRSVAVMEHDEQNGMDPSVAGAYIARLVEAKRVKPINTIGFTYNLFCLLVRILPARLLNWLVGMIYAK